MCQTRIGSPYSNRPRSTTASEYSNSEWQPTMPASSSSAPNHKFLLLRGIEASKAVCSISYDHRISRVGLLADHVHLTLGCVIDQSPEEIALSYRNNCAYSIGMKPIFQFGYYTGTIGEYDRRVGSTLACRNSLVVLFRQVTSGACQGAKSIAVLCRVLFISPTNGRSAKCKTDPAGLVGRKARTPRRII